MGYSKIKSIEVKNFMVYEDAIINFDDSNIINIKGYNSGGKSTMLKAIAVCLMNMYPKAQGKFIRHGEDYFRIVVNFDDGVTIVKYKYIKGQSLYEVYKDEECIYSTKEGNRLTKVDGVPKIIEDYLGLCVVSTGCLNYQVRQDPLWLIETTGSENYASLNEILKTEEISKANALLNSDTNSLNSEIASTEASLQEAKLSLVDVEGYSIELLNSLEEKEYLCKTLSFRYKKLKEIKGILRELNSIKDIPEVKKIEINRVSAISEMNNISNEIANLKEYPSIEKISISKLKDIVSLKKQLNQISKISTEIPEVSVINYNAILNLKNIIDIVNDLKEVSSSISSLKKESAMCTNELKEIVSEAEKKGIRFIQCENCGTYMEVEGS